MMPLKWESPEQIRDIIDNYFEETPAEEITLTGLCLALDTNKQTIANYQEKPEFKHMLEMAKMKIEHAYEKSLRKTGRSGDIFALKNFGWTDRMDLSADLNAKVSVDTSDYREKIKEKLAKIATERTDEPTS